MKHKSDLLAAAETAILVEGALVLGILVVLAASYGRWSVLLP